LKLQFLLEAKVWAVLKELSWGDRFERDLQEKMDEVEGSPERLEEIIDQLTEMGLVYQLKGERGSPYLALTYKGQEVVGRLLETEEILDSDNET
jgi:DNA-binding MarR family transcriptional regulator